MRAIIQLLCSTVITWSSFSKIPMRARYEVSLVQNTVYPKKYAHGFCFAVLCCGYTLTDFPISIRLTSLALWQSNDCPSASKATPMNMDKYFMWIHYERLHNHNKAKHNKTVCLFLGIYCMMEPLYNTIHHNRYQINWQWQMKDTDQALDSQKTPHIYLKPTVELWSVLYVYFREKWPSYKEVWLYNLSPVIFILC